MAVAAPLAIGGVHDAFALAAGGAVVVLLAAAAVRAPRGAGVPLPLVGFVLLAIWSLIQTIPGLAGLGGDPAPGSLAADVRWAHEGTGIAPVLAMAPTLADARTAVVRWSVLAALFLLGRLVPWRQAAASIALAATCSAIVAYVHAATKADAIFGVYRALQVDLADVPYWFGTFVNPNHQAAFLLLGLGCALALAVEVAAAGRRDPVPRAGDRLILAAAASVVMLPALGATLSRSGVLLAGVLVATSVVSLVGVVRHAGRASPHDHAADRRRLAVIAAAVVVALVSAVPLAAPAFADMLPWWSDPDAVVREPKIRLLRESLPMFRIAPLGGIGAGTFADLWPRYASVPRVAWATHLESALLGPVLAHGLAGAAAVVAAAAVPILAIARCRSRPGQRGRRLTALTLVVVGAEGLADHWWATLGVAAPAAVLAGSLVGGRPWANDATRARRRSRWIHGGLAALTLVAIFADLATRSERLEVRHERNRAIARGAPYVRSLALRPLDGRLHAVIGRRLAASDRWAQACHHAEVAARFAPILPDGHLLDAACRWREGDTEGLLAALRRALLVIPTHPSEALARFLVAVTPNPATLAAAMDAQTPWGGLAHRLRDVSLDHALAVLERAAKLHPEDPTPLDLAVRLWLRVGAFEAAEAGAAELRRRFPTTSAPYRATIAVLRARGAPEAEIRALLRDALARGDLDEDVRDELRDLLAQSLAKGGPNDRAQARRILTELLSRPSPPEVRIRRARLRDRLVGP
ncbi:MAG: hypothetical protein D6705_05760 [Deltaproteobacteria bacterium]|nr:MAG: hypothetical protein D6705_05760 [Deltaproteobacteria bacterium]